MHVCFFLYTVQRENERHVLAPSRRIEAPVSSTGKKSDTDPVADARQSPEKAPAAGRPAGVIPALPVRPAWRPSSTSAPTHHQPRRAADHWQRTIRPAAAAANCWSNGPPARPCARTRALSVRRRPIIPFAPIQSDPILRSLMHATAGPGPPSVDR